MWDLPRPGLEPVSPALAGRFLTTEPPGKSPLISFWNQWPKFNAIAFVKLKSRFLETILILYCFFSWRYSPRQQLPITTFWVLRLLPRNVGSLATSSENQRVEDCHQHHEAYGYFLLIQTRWQDNDQYGHGNNAVYYSYLDTIINQYLRR